MMAGTGDDGSGRGGGGDDGKKKLSRSDHAQKRASQGRRTGPAFNDARNARPSDVFVQPDGRYIVRGPRGREHVFEPDGEHVTSIDRSQSAHQGKVLRGERLPATSDQYETFQERFQ